MDLNNLTLRLERIYTAIGDTTDAEIQKYIKVTIVGDANSPNPTIKITFNNNQSESKTTNIVLVIIEHLAKLKDHLKNKMGNQKQLVEKKVNESLELQLIMDLSNAEKHGYPVKTERSKKSPRIQNITTSLVIPPQEKIGINPRTGEIVEPGSCFIRVEAEIVDKSGTLICRWPQMINKALGEWENFIQEHRLG